METALDKIIEFLLSQSMHLAVLFAAIGTLVWLLNKRSAHVRYLLWLLILAKCLIPPLLTVPVAILPEPADTAVPAPLPQAEAENEAIAPLPSMAADPEPVYQAAESKPKKSLPEQTAAGPTFSERAAHLFTVNRMGMLWICGSVVYLTWILIRAVRFQIRLKQQRISMEEPFIKEIADLAEQFWPGLKVRAYLLEGIGQPFVWGPWRGTIYLPANFAHTTAGRKRHAILLHEMAHIARMDALVNMIQVIAQGIYWFHPLVWIANRIIRAEREKCCDETAIAKLKTTPKEYGGAIVDVLTGEYQSRMAIPSLAVAGPAKNIEDRLKTIMNPRRKFYTRPTFIGLCMVLFLASILIPTAIAITHKKLKPEDLTPPFEVSGTVTNAQTGQPIEGAIVFDDGYGPTPRQETTTDAAGAFLYKTWNEEHNITAQADGYEPQTLVLKTFPFNNSKKLHFKLLPQKSDPAVCSVDFEITSRDFRPGDSMEIAEIVGNRPRIEVGGTYTVKGKYTLSSQDRAMLHIYATDGQTHSDQGSAVERGSGEFARTFAYLEEGDLHLSFYPADGGSSFGGLYFTAKDSVLRPHGPVDTAPADFDILANVNRGLCYLVVSIQNNAEYILPKHRIRYYRGNPNKDLDEAGQPHAGWYEAGPIESGKTWNERTRDFYLPDGEYEFTVVLDYDQAVSETDETNNLAAIRVRIQNGQLIEKSPLSPGNEGQIHSKKTSEPVTLAEGYIAEVPEIGKVELVSVCPLQSQKDHLGWDPDGGPLSQMLYADRFMQEEEDAKPVSFVLKTDSNIFIKEFRSDQLFQTRRNWSNSNGICDAKDDRFTRKDNQYYYSLQGLFRPESTAADLNLLIQRDQWTLRVIYDGKYMIGKTDNRVRFLESYDSAGGVKVVFDHDYEGMDIRLEATCIDTSGNGQRDRTVPAGVSEVTNSEGRKHHLAFFSNITLSTIREIRLQTRPQKYTLVRFKNVALQPIVHSAGQTKTADELQTADKVQVATISDVGRQNLNLDTGDVRSPLSLDDKLRYGIDLSLERYGLDKKGDPQITALNMAFREMDVPPDTPLEEISPEKIAACFPLSAFPVNQPRVVVEWNTNPIFVFQTQEGAAGMVRAAWENYSVNTPCQIQYCLLPDRSVPLVQYSWGPPAEGLSCRLRPYPAAGRMGGPALALDLRNQSEKPYSFVSVPAAHCEIELDGQWYGYAQTPAVDAPVYTLAPNHVCPDGLAINLNELEGSWALPADGKPLRYAPGVARAWGERLKLTPGRHTIRLRFRPREWLEQDNQGQEEPFVLSNPLTIDIPDPLEAENGIPPRPESKTQADREAEKPEAAVDSMRITFYRGVPLADALQMLSKYYKQTIIPSQAVIDARDRVPATDLFNVTSLEMALEAILGTNRYIKDGNFIRVCTAQEYAALRPGEKTESEVEKIPVKVSARLLLLPDDPEKIESVFDNAGIGFPKIFTSVTEGPADSQAIRTQFEARIRSLDPASASLSAFLAGEQVESLLKATQKEPDAAVLSAPTVLVWSGENAEISMGEKLPSGTDSANTVSCGIRMNILPTVLRPSGMIHIQIRSLVSGIKGLEKQGGKDVPIMEVAEISSEITMPKDSTCLLFGPVLEKGKFFEDSNSTAQPRRLLMLIKPTIMPDSAGQEIGEIGKFEGVLPPGMGGFRPVD